MSSFSRASFLLLGAAAAGFLVWLAAQIGRGTTGGYWAVLGILAGAGLTLALAGVLGRPGGAHPAPMLVILLCGLVVAGWVAIALQPHANWFRNHVTGWSGDIGIRALVGDLGLHVSVLVFGIGALLGFTLDSLAAAARAPKRRPAVVEEEPPVRESAPAPRRDAPTRDEPAPEREGALAAPASEDER